MSSLSRAWTGLFDEERDAYVLGLLRLSLSALLFLNCGRLILELISGGYFADFFHAPIVPESWLPSRSGYALLLGLEAGAAILAGVGIWPREALLAASGIGLFLLTCDRLQYHNNRYELLLLGLLFAFTPCDRSFLLVRGEAHALSSEGRRGPTFARRLFQAQVSLVYLGSAFGKLSDAEWRGGQVLLVRFTDSVAVLAERGLSAPSWLAALLGSALFASLAAKAAISTEVFIAVGSWLPGTRRLALWFGVLFHIGIELSARVELFSYLMLASYLAFVVPELRERRFEYDATNAGARIMARLLALLDWCARFEISPLSPNGARSARVFVTDRAGHRASGFAGLSHLAEAVPLLFPLWLPLRLLTARQRRRQS